MAQQAQSVVLCGACHHPREAHADWREARTSSFTQDPLVLREHCRVRGCSCRNYVGLVWEKGTR